MQTAEVSEWKDPYLRLAADIKPRRGFSVLDEASRTPFKVMQRYFEGSSHGTHDRSATVLRRDPDELLCTGAALGVDSTGVMRHAWANQGLIGFTGFCAENLEGGKVNVRTRGHIILTIEGLSKGCEGLPVYANGPDVFTVESGGLEIGRVRFIENVTKRQASVAFRAWDDPTPLDLRVDRGRRV